MVAGGMLADGVGDVVADVVLHRESRDETIEVRGTDCVELELELLQPINAQLAHKITVVKRIVSLIIKLF